AGLTGLEPATSAVTVRHSNQTELQPLPANGRGSVFHIRAGDRTRTGDLLHGKQTLYQLSYARELRLPRERERVSGSGVQRTGCKARSHFHTLERSLSLLPPTGFSAPTGNRTPVSTLKEWRPDR